MNPSAEERLQRLAEHPSGEDERQLSPQERLELSAYRDLFSILSEEPGFEVAPDFGRRVMARVEAAREPIWEWLPVPALLLAGGAVAGAFLPVRAILSQAVSLTGHPLSIETFSIVAPNPEQGLALLAVIAMYLVDRLIARPPWT